MNQFSERYKTFSNTDLLRVIENQTDYQGEAVEAARDEITHRKLSEQELTASKNELQIEQQEKLKRNEKRAEVERKVKNFGNSAFDTINPVQQSAPTAERLILMITIVFGVITLFKWYSMFGVALYMLTDNSAGWDMSSVEYFLPLIILPVATILFWFRNKAGWTLLTAYLTYSTISAFVLIILTWNTTPTGFAAIDSLFPKPSLTAQILITIFFGGTLWVVNRKDIQESFKISRLLAIGTIVITGMLTLLYIAQFLPT